MSTLLGAFLSRHTDLVDIPKFHALTNPEKLPSIHPKAAMLFIDAERQIYGDGEEHGTTDDSKQVESTGFDLSKLTQRCVDVLGDTWKDMDAQEQGDLMTLAKKQSQSVLVAFFSATLLKAQDDLNEIEKNQAQELKLLQKKLADANQAHSKAQKREKKKAREST